MDAPRTLTVAEFLTEYPAIAKRVNSHAFADPVYVYEGPQHIDGDFSLDYSTPTQPVGAHVFLSDLDITGNLLNLEGQFATALVVEGVTRAQNIVTGHAFVYLNEAHVPGVVLGYYNDGHTTIRALHGPLSISDDHDEMIRHVGPHVGIYDGYGGFVINVDDIELPFEIRDQTRKQAIISWIDDGTWVEFWDNPPENMEYALLDGEYNIKWYEWVVDGIAKGAPAQDNRFTQAADMMRHAFQTATAD